MCTFKNGWIFHVLVTAHVCFRTGDKVIKGRVCLSHTGWMQHSVTTVTSVGGKADFFHGVVINIKSGTTGGEILHYSDNKTSVFITRQTGAQGQTACSSHDHNSQIIGYGCHSSLSKLHT